MARARLTDEERAARKRRSFSDAAYRHYDPAKEGYGSADEWARTAEQMASGTGGFERVASVRSDKAHRPHLKVLGLAALPQDLATLRRAYHDAAMRTHPDRGGTVKAAQDVNAAFEVLSKAFG